MSKLGYIDARYIPNISNINVQKLRVSSLKHFPVGALPQDARDGEVLAARRLRGGSGLWRCHLATLLDVVEAVRVGVRLEEQIDSQPTLLKLRNWLIGKKTWSLADRDRAQADRQKYNCKIRARRGANSPGFNSDLRRLQPELGHAVAFGSFSRRLSVPTWCGGGRGRRRRPQFRERPLLLGPTERRRRREDDGMGRRLSHLFPRNCCRWRTLDWLRWARA